MTEHSLHSVFNENIRNHQIGGLTDGMDTDVARDLGFETPEAVLQKIADSSDPNFVRPQDMSIADEAKVTIPADAREAIDALRERAVAGRRYRTTGYESGRLAAKKFLDDQERK